MTFLQTAVNATADIAYSNINFATGCITVIIALSGAVVYLYKRLETKNDLFISELRSSNDKLMNVCNSYAQFVNKMDDFIDLKKK